MLGGNQQYGRPPGFGGFPGQNAPPGMAGSPGMRRSSLPRLLSPC